MPVTFTAAGALAVNATTVTLPVVAPTLSAGDLMICCLINKSVTANTISPPDGTWTTVRAQEINDCTTAADDHAYVIFAKFASAGDSGATFNFTKATDDNLLFAGVISAWTGVVAFDATPAARSLNAAAADAVTFPAYDPVVACHVVFMAFYGNDLTTFAAAMSSDTNPDCTVRFDLETATGNDATIACTSGDNTDGANIASRTWASASTTDAGSTGVAFGLVAGIYVAVASEALKISGSGRVDLIDLLAPRLHLTDGPVVAALTGGANLSATITSESLKVSEAATSQLTQLMVSLSEAVRVTDSVTAREDPLQASVTDGLRVSDAVSPTLNPLQASPTEALKIVDAVSASLGTLLVSASESLKVADVILTSLDPLRATPGESLRVVDGPASASLGNLIVSLVESSRLSDSVSASETPILVVVTAESLRLIDLNQGAVEIEHVIRISDGPVIATLITGVFSATLSESVRLTDTVLVTLDPIETTRAEAFVVVDGPATVSIDYSTSRVEEIRVSETLEIMLDPLQAVPPESLIVADDVPVVIVSADLLVSSTESIRVSDTNQGLVQLYGVLHLTDGPVLAALTLDVQTSIPNEESRITDALALTLDPLRTVLISDHLTIIETVLASLNPLQAAVTVEALRVVDGPANVVLLAPGTLSVVISESILIRDLQQGWIGLEHTVRITDGPVLAVLIENVLSVTITEAIKVVDASLSASLGTLMIPVGQESLRLFDAVSVTLSPLNATTTESSRVSDAVTPTLDPLNATLSDASRVSDSPAAALDTLLTAATEGLRLTDSLATVLDPLQSVFSEALVVVDQAATTLDPLTTSATEALVVVDGQPAVVLLEPGILSASLSESILIRDANQGLVQLYGVLHITDGPVIAVFGNDLSASLSESIRPTDTLTVLREPLQAILSESLRLGLDLASAVELVSLEALTLTDGPPTAALVVSGSVNTTEALRLSELVSVTLDPLQASAPNEALKISDSPVTLIGLAVESTEALRVADTVSASLISMGQLEASLSEAVVVVDTVTAQTNLLRGSATESVIVQDQLAASLGLLGASQTEAIRCQDIVTASLDAVAVVVADESVRVVDSVTARINLLQVDAAESVRLSDTSQASLSHLQAIISESVRVQDVLVASLGLLGASATEAVRCLDSVSVAMDPVTLAIESLRVSDTVTARIDPLRAEPVELVRLSDTVQASLSHLQTTVSESIRVQETLSLGVDLLSVSLTEAIYCQDVASVSFILAQPREFFVVAAQDRWCVVDAQDRWFIVDGEL